MCLLDCFSCRQRMGTWLACTPSVTLAKLTVTSHDRAGISREWGSHPRWQQQRQRPLLDLPARLLQRCEVHEYIFSVITSGVICVLKLCYALRQTHILMTCLHVLAQARPTMSCIPLVTKYARSYIPVTKAWKCVLHDRFKSMLVGCVCMLRPDFGPLLTVQPDYKPVSPF